ncbi:STAS domain-containing protein [Aquimarina sp. W85]|uniref:STAS domain-containing protein n=1 Tax=Aquimarina rhodophyticola TaxID=3342246 RepID=UPI00366F0F9D
MALSITNTQGIFEINGSLLATNVNCFESHFTQLLKTTEKVIVSLDKLHDIDAYAAQIVTKLYKKAIQSNKIFSVIGKQNNAVQEVFGENSYVLRNDYV